MLIIDMKMPKRCFDCPMHDYVSNRSSSLPSHVEYGWRSIEPVCNAHHELKPIPNGNERPDWCPIKGVLPDEHGDLVDADTVLWGEEVPDSEGIVVPVTIGDVIEGYDVQIVIAAERKDDGTTAD